MCVYQYAYWADAYYAYILVWIYLSCTVLYRSRWGLRVFRSVAWLFRFAELSGSAWTASSARFGSSAKGKTDRRHAGQIQLNWSFCWRCLYWLGFNQPHFMWHQSSHWSQFKARWFLATFLMQTEHLEEFYCRTRIKWDITTCEETSLMESTIRINIVANPRGEIFPSM